MNDRVIMGIIDDDIPLKGRIIAGHRVLGGMDSVAEWVTKYRIDGITITCLMEPEKEEQVVSTFEKLGVRVSVWACDEKVLADPRWLKEKG
jgi:FlaA1/EpsC-like NDP-sugar epimerase